MNLIIHLPRHPHTTQCVNLLRPPSPPLSPIPLCQGVILYGEPGTGKTLLAKAVANSTSATFLRVVGSELIQKYLGDGPKLVRELFRVADDLAPSIVFIGAVEWGWTGWVGGQAWQGRGGVRGRMVAGRGEGGRGAGGEGETGGGGEGGGGRKVGGGILGAAPTGSPTQSVSHLPSLLVTFAQSLMWHYSSAPRLHPHHRHACFSLSVMEARCSGHH